MLTARSRSEERTGVQTSMPYGGAYDLQSDFVMVYRLNETTAQRIADYKARGFRVHLMTGISWGQYNDFRDGEFDGQPHWDEGQMRMDGVMVQHGSGDRNPYMIPSVAFADYLAQRLRVAVDAGVDAIHLEEPEIWCFSGYSEWFRQEYLLYYHEPWQPPHESADAFYRAGKLKAYLYTRTLGRVADAIKEYALKKHGRYVQLIVPTHSLINYTQYGISSPESMLLELPGIDGYIAQVWSDTSRVENVYRGVRRQRVFEGAFLEYGIMQELTRGAGRRMWFLQDPASDDPRGTWEYYRACYLEGLTAALLQPHVSHYEICPWPHRVLMGRYPKENGEPMPADYLTILLTLTQALRDMDQPFAWLGEDTVVGILLSDTMLYQRTYGDFAKNRGEDISFHGRDYNPGIPYAEYGQESNASGFFGMALPLLARGIHAQPVQLENAGRLAGYLDDYDMLCLSYEFMKPENPALHFVLAEWVRSGGMLLLIGDGSDPFGRIRHWWNQGRMDYATPMAHLTDLLGLGRRPAEGVHAVGKGRVGILPVHPAQIAYDADTESRYIRLLEACRAEKELPPFSRKNFFALRRGPYVIAAALRDSQAQASFSLQGRFVDLMDPALSVKASLSLSPGEYCIAADLDRYDEKVCLVASAGRVEDWRWADALLSFSLHAPDGSSTALRIKGPRPIAVTADGQPLTFAYDDLSETVLLRPKGPAAGTFIEIRFPQS